MEEHNRRLRSHSKQLLEDGKVDRVIGWGQGRFFWQTPARTVEDPGQVGDLAFTPCTDINLGAFVMAAVREAEDPHGRGDDEPPRIAVWARGCDSRSINRLANDGIIDRERVTVLGLPCPGTVDPQNVREKTGKRVRGITWADPEGREILVHTSDGGEIRLTTDDVLAEKCRRCTHPEPVNADWTAGSGAREGADDRLRFEAVKRLGDLDAAGRYAFWARQFDRCIRCYACRNICPACNCRECVFDSALPDQPEWLGKGSDLPEKQQYHLVRMFHVAGRCVECGECSRVCPLEIPVFDLMQKAAADLRELFDFTAAGLEPDEIPPLMRYSLDDPEIEEVTGDEAS